ncbi:MAG: hypothetical protein PW734_05570 [Verrucomicrobium sp.]|nr:hypothetical protein [Verrucomicrobium sp.]
MPSYSTWAALTPEEAHAIFLCVQETQKKLYRSAIDTFSKPLGLRPNLLLEMPKTERHAAFGRILAHPQMEEVGFNFLCHWLVEGNAPLLVAWLDALGIAHDGKGMVEDFPPEPSTEALKKAADAVLAQFEPRLVAIYLRTFNDIDGVQWDGLEKLVETDPRLKLEAPTPAAG